MSNELLIQIIDKLERMEVRLENVVTVVQDTRAQMNSRFDSLDTEVYVVKKDVAAIKSTVDLMSGEVPQDVTGMLKQINTKLDAQQDLAGKVEELKIDIKVVKKAITNQ